MKKVSLGCLFCALFLGACVKTEPPKFTPPAPPSIPDFSNLRMNADGILECLINAKDKTQSEARIELSIDKEKLQEIFALVDQHKIKSADDFWKRLGRQDRNQLAQWIAAGYDKLESDSALRSKEVSAYNTIFANGMINVSKEEREAAVIYIAEVVGTKQNNKISYQPYGFKIFQEGGESDKKATVTYCTGDLK